LLKKSLIILTLGLIVSGCAGAVDPVCTSAYDNTRTLDQTKLCLVNYRQSYDQLVSDVDIVLQNPDILNQPVNPNILAQPVNPNLF
jgi:hypothetical protein